MPQTGGVAGMVANGVAQIAGGAPPMSAAAPVAPMMAQPVAVPMGGQAMPQMGAVSIPAPPDYANGLAEMLTTALVQQNQFIVLERGKLNDVLTEQSFGASASANAASAAQAGKVLGAQALIYGDITMYSEKQSQVGGQLNLLRSVSGQAGLAVSRVTAQVAIDVRLVDAVTGQVTASVRGMGNAAATGVATQFQARDRSIGTGGAAQTPLGQASRAAIDNAVAGIAQRLRSMVWSGRVVDVRGADVYINAGAVAGIAAGMTFDIFHPGDALVDPESHVTLGAPDQRIGSVTITSVQPQFAVGKVNEGSGMQRNDVVRVGVRAP